MSSVADVPPPLAGFHPLLQAPARLQVMAVVAQAQDVEFTRLREITGTSDSVMSKHLSALAEAGLIRIRKGLSDGRQRTWASITRAGRRTFNDHVSSLHRIVAGDSPSGGR